MSPHAHRRLEQWLMKMDSKGNALSKPPLSRIKNFFIFDSDTAWMISHYHFHVIEKISCEFQLKTLKKKSWKGE